MNQISINGLDKLSMQKLILLVIGSVLLCLSILMSVFTPYPLVLAIVLFGRAKGITVSILGLLGVFILGVGFFKNISVFGVYFCSLVFAIGISEIVLRKLKPISAMVLFGLALNGLIFGSIFLTTTLSGVSIKDFLVKEISAEKSVFQEMKKSIESADTLSSENIEFLSTLSEPEKLADQIIEQVPAYLFISIFFTLWVNLYLTLNVRNSLGKGLTTFSEQDLLNFKVPDHVIWLVIATLIMAVWGGDLGYSWMEPIGMTLLKCLGIFYFFQGFGVYIEFLNFFNVKGFLRTFLIVITVVSANQLVAAIGLFDMFINFRRFFKKKN